MVQFNGYGGDKYELEIVSTIENDKVFTPTTNAISGDIRSYLTLKPGEEKVFHHEWNLFKYSAGGCEGPYYGDLVKPGKYKIHSWLNLGYDNMDKNFEVSETITITQLNFTIPEYSIAINEDNYQRFPSMVNVSKDYNSLEIFYQPTYSVIANDTGKLNIEARLYENGFLYLAMIGEEFEGRSRGGPYSQLNISINLSQINYQIVVGIYDQFVVSGWGKSVWLIQVDE